MKKIYITKEISVFTDEQAENFLSVNNDFRFLNHEEEGVHKVDDDRWRVAQIYEKKTWMENNLSTSDDRNYEHLSRFDYYNSAENLLREKKSVIELGCGPFTNLRLLLPKLNVNKISLVDPLLNDYLGHPYCFYKNKKINDIDVDFHSTCIENLNTNLKYDVLIMINVIEHCFDVDKIFNKILSLLDTGGIFIFSDVYFNQVDELVKNLYDAGHPLRISEKKLNQFLENFDSIYEKRFNGLYSQSWRNDVYFIGIKK